MTIKQTINQMKIDKIILHNNKLQKKLLILILMIVVIQMLNLKKIKQQQNKRNKTLRLRIKKIKTPNKRNLWRQKNHKLKPREVLTVIVDLKKKKRKKQIR